MKRYRRHRDDDDSIVQDGQVLRIPLTMMDSMDPVQKALARSSARVNDGSLHRPGFRIAATDRTRKTIVRDPRGRLLEAREEEEQEDGISDAERAAAYRDHERYLNDAWMGGNGPPGAYPYSTAAGRRAPSTGHQDICGVVAMAR